MTGAVPPRDGTARMARIIEIGDDGQARYIRWVCCRFGLDGQERRYEMLGMPVPALKRGGPLSPIAETNHFPLIGETPSLPQPATRVPPSRPAKLPAALPPEDRACPVSISAGSISGETDRTPGQVTGSAMHERGAPRRPDTRLPWRAAILWPALLLLPAAIAGLLL